MGDNKMILPGNVGVEAVAYLTDVSRPTAFRWAQEPGKLPTPVYLPGHPKQWPRSTIEEWAQTYHRVRACERAMEIFADAKELDPLLRRAARLIASRLRETTKPIQLRGRLADIAKAVKWKPGELTENQQRQARKLILQLLDLVSGGAK